MGISPSGVSPRPANLGNPITFWVWGQIEGLKDKFWMEYEENVANREVCVRLKPDMIYFGRNRGFGIELEPVEAFTKADCSAEPPLPLKASLLKQL